MKSRSFSVNSSLKSTQVFALPFPLFRFSSSHGITTSQTGASLPPFLSFLSPVVSLPRNTNVSNKTLLTTEICDLQGDTILQLKSLLLHQLLRHRNLSWPRANLCRDLLSFYFLVHGRSQPHRYVLSGDVPGWAKGHVKVSQVWAVLGAAHGTSISSLLLHLLTGYTQVSWPTDQSNHQTSG